MIELEEEIFRSRSTTFFLSSKLFPSRLRNNVTKLYSFVRTIDDLVDQPKPNAILIKKMHKAWRSQDSSILEGVYKKVIENILSLSEKNNFEPQWMEAFFASMQADIDSKKYETLNEVLQYTYGSAEVIGLMLSRIFNLPKEAEKYAQLQGRAWQWLNFVRDIEDDIELGRSYFPQDDLEKFEIKNMSSNQAKYSDFIRFELERYRMWQDQAYEGYKYIPQSLRIAISNAAKVYNGVAEKIYNDLSQK